jgi:hypothetical protein
MVETAVEVSDEVAVLDTDVERVLLAVVETELVWVVVTVVFSHVEYAPLFALSAALFTFATALAQWLSETIRIRLSMHANAVLCASFPDHANAAFPKDSAVSAHFPVFSSSITRELLNDPSLQVITAAPSGGQRSSNV